MKAENIHRIKNIGKSEHSKIHCWLRNNYGNADKCVHCNGNKSLYEYALKHGFKYEKNRKNFIMLCRSCHRKYDYKYRLPNNVKSISKLTLDGKFVTKYKSITGASKKTRILIGSIGNCLTGISSKAGNFKWVYNE